MLAEYDENGSLKTYYTRGAELISQERGGEKHYYLYDGFDSVRILTDEDGTATDFYTFDAFGNLTDQIGDTENSYLYRGEQYDSFTGLYYLRARYMNPATGTFITMDEYAGSVFEPVSLHKYLYANANPVNNSDPTGYSTDADNQVAVAGIAVLAATVTATCILGTQLLASLNTTISTFSIFDDRDILNWSEDIASGAVTSPNLAKKIKDRSKDDPTDIAIDIALPDDPPDPERPYYYAAIDKKHYVNIHFRGGYGLTLQEAAAYLMKGQLIGTKESKNKYNIYTKYESDAQKLCDALGGKCRSNLDENGKNRTTPHFHAGMVERQHIFFGWCDSYKQCLF